MNAQNIDSILRRSCIIAKQYQHKYATYEHLLLSLITELDIQKLFRYYQIDTPALTIKLSKYLSEKIVPFLEDSFNEAILSIELQRIIEKIIIYKDSKHLKKVSSLYLLKELLTEPADYVLSCLKEYNFTQEELTSYLNKYEKKLNIEDHVPLSQMINSKNIVKTQASKQDKNISKINLNPSEKEESSSSSYLDLYCINLNLKGLEGAIDCLVGRESEITRTIEILCRRRKNNALLVGEPGVGKTAIAEGLALKILKREVPNLLKNCIIYALDIGSVLAGTKYRGEFEDRIKKIFNEVKSRPEVIIFIDEIHTLVGAGASVSGSLDASNLLKPAFAKGEIRCIGATTFREYRNYFEKDMALVRRFQRIMIKEPDVNNTIAILNGLKSYYEQYHKVVYSEEAIKATVLLSMRYIHNRHLPDKAIDLMDEAGARKNIYNNSNNLVITQKDIEELVSSIVRITNISGQENDAKNLRDLENNLKNNIFGQDQAIKQLCASIKLSKAGLKNTNKPIGCYLFAGLGGVGKTTLAKLLAKFCNMELIQFDMSEFSEPHNTSKLVGSPPGYTGFEQGGQLTEAVEKNQYSIILFDDLEKAHPDVINLLLQIIDDGTLNDNTGKQINFSNTIIILTTNIKASETMQNSIGFNNNTLSPKKNMLESVSNSFDSEILNKIDDVIIFNPLDDKIINMIIKKNLDELALQLTARNVNFIIEPSTIRYLAKNYFTENNEACTLERLISNQIKQPLADEILFGKLKDGGTVKVNAKHNKLFFQFSGVVKKPTQLTIIENNLILNDIIAVNS